MSADEAQRTSAFLESIGLASGQRVDGWAIAGASVGVGQVTVSFERSGRMAEVQVRAASADEKSFSRTRSFGLTHDAVPAEQGRDVAALMRAITDRVRARDAGGVQLPEPPCPAPAAPSPAVNPHAERFAKAYAERELMVVPLARMAPEAFSRLQAEVLAIAAGFPPYVRTDCDGPPYRTHSLYNATGLSQDPEGDDQSIVERRLLVPQMPEIRRLAELFMPELRVLSIACSPPGAHLRTHVENVAFSPSESVKRDVYGESNILVRLHLPVLADDRAYSTIAGRQYRFQPGLLYLYNNSLPHSTDNEGDSDRYHLLLDAWLSERLWRDVLSPILDPTASEPLPPPFVPLKAGV